MRGRHWDSGRRRVEFISEGQALTEERWWSRKEKEKEGYTSQSKHDACRYNILGTTIK